jgi:hypothetical protein
MIPPQKEKGNQKSRLWRHECIGYNLSLVNPLAVADTDPNGRGGHLARTPTTEDLAMRSLLTKLFSGTSGGRPPARRRSIRPALEVLEERAVPAGVTLYWWPQGGNHNWSYNTGTMSNWSTSNTSYTYHAPPTTADDCLFNKVTTDCLVDANGGSPNQCHRITQGSTATDAKIKIQSNSGLEVVGGTSTINGNRIDYADGSSWVEFSGGSVTFKNLAFLGQGTTDTHDSAYFDNGVSVTLASDTASYGLATDADLDFGDCPPAGYSTTTGATVTIGASLSLSNSANVHEDYGTLKVTYSPAPPNNGEAIVDGDSTSHLYIQTSGSTEIAGSNVRFDGVPVHLSGSSLKVDGGDILVVKTKDVFGYNVQVVNATLNLQAGAQLTTEGNNPTIYVGVTGTLQMADGSAVGKTTSGTGTFTLELDSGTLTTVAGSSVVVGGLLKSDAQVGSGSQSTISMGTDDDNSGGSKISVDGLNLKNCDMYFDAGKRTVGGAFWYSQIVTSGSIATQVLDSTDNNFMDTLDVPTSGTTADIIHDTAPGTNALSGSLPNLYQTGYESWSMGWNGSPTSNLRLTAP